MQPRMDRRRSPRSPSARSRGRQGRENGRRAPLDEAPRRPRPKPYKPRSQGEREHRSGGRSNPPKRRRTTPPKREREVELPVGTSYQGKLVGFCYKKGWGFIDTKDGTRYFAHKSDFTPTIIDGRPRRIMRGAIVTFIPKPEKGADPDELDRATNIKLSLAVTCKRCGGWGHTQKSCLSKLDMAHDLRSSRRDKRGTSGMAKKYRRRENRQKESIDEEEYDYEDMKTGSRSIQEVDEEMMDSFVSDL